MGDRVRPRVGLHILTADIETDYDIPHGLGQSSRSVTIKVRVTFFNQEDAHAFERDVRNLLENPSER